MKMQMALTLVAGLLAFSGAQAHEAPNLNGPIYDCQLAGDIHGHSIAIGIGGTRLRGTGVITCRHNITGEVTQMPVQMKLTGLGVGLDFTHVRSVRVLSVGVGVNDPRYFFQSYAVGATAGVNLLRLGISADAAIKVSGRDGAGFEVGLIGKDIVGLGAHLYGMAFMIQPVALD